MWRTWLRTLRTGVETMRQGLVTFATVLRVRSRTGDSVTKAGEYRCRRCPEHGHFQAGGTFPACGKDHQVTVWFWRGPYRG